MDPLVLQFRTEGNGSSEDFSMELSGVIEMSFFNMKVMRWEPVLEPWQPVVKASLGVGIRGQTTARIMLACDQVRGNAFVMCAFRSTSGFCFECCSH